MAIKTIKDVELAGKRVFVRVDFNVPIDEEGQVKNESKIKAALPTLNYILEQGASLVLASHLGRPKGQVKEELRLDPVAGRLSELLGMEVIKKDEVVGEEVFNAAASLQPGQVLLLENVRFHPGEEKNDPELAKAYAGMADIFVSDAFGTAHRAHASNAGIAAYLPAVAGFLIEREITNLTESVENPKRPLVAVIGGSKVADKIKVMEYFLHTADHLLLGGGMANTFLCAKQYNMGNSLVEEDKVARAAELMRMANANGVNLFLPVDLVVAGSLNANAQTEVVGVGEVPDGKMAVDIGPQTRKIYAEMVAQAGTVLWNGPLGVFEVEQFSHGTLEMARAVAESPAFSIVGGGDVVAAVEMAGVTDKISHLSTGGGAALEFWEGRKLPGLTVLAEI